MPLAFDEKGMRVKMETGEWCPISSGDVIRYAYSYSGRVDIDAAELALAAFCEDKIAKKMEQYLRFAIHRGGMPLPVALAPHVGCKLGYSDEFPDDLFSCLCSFECVLNGKPILAVYEDYQLTRTFLPRAAFKNLSYSRGGGQTERFSGSGLNVIQYARFPNKGKAIRNVVVSTESGSYGFLVERRCVRTSEVTVCGCWEVDGTIAYWTGPGPAPQLEGYEVKKVVRRYIDSFSMREVCQGLIVCVNGIEYIIMQENMVSALIDDKTIFSASGRFLGFVDAPDGCASLSVPTMSYLGSAPDGEAVMTGNHMSMIAGSATLEDYSSVFKSCESPEVPDDFPMIVPWLDPGDLNYEGYPVGQILSWVKIRRVPPRWGEFIAFLCTLRVPMMRLYFREIMEGLGLYVKSGVVLHRQSVSGSVAIRATSLARTRTCPLWYDNYVERRSSKRTGPATSTYDCRYARRILFLGVNEWGMVLLKQPEEGYVLYGETHADAVRRILEMQEYACDRSYCDDVSLGCRVVFVLERASGREITWEEAEAFARPLSMFYTEYGEQIVSVRSLGALRGVFLSLV